MADINANITNTRGRPRDAILAAVVNPDGTPVGSSSMVTPRPVYTRNMVTAAGSIEVVPADSQRTGLTLRNDSTAKMYFRTDGEAGDGVGYPMDAGRGYSFEALGLLPDSAVTVWCGSADNRVAILYATGSAPYA